VGETLFHEGAVKAIRSSRLELVPATLAHLEADLKSPEALGHLLGVAVPTSWPPGEYDRSAMEFFRARLAEDPDAVGWYGWYAIHRQEGEESTVIGVAGYLGRPGIGGTIEVGYSIAPEFQARAYATEVVEALVIRAWTLPEVSRVIAHTQPSNVASVKVLERCGFTSVGPGGNSGEVEYEKLRPTT
jgi:RimJ/RimL family protein N-acetyltransferase